MSLMMGALGGAGDAAQKYGEQQQKVWDDQQLLRTRESLDAQKSVMIEQAKQDLKYRRQLAFLGYPGASMPTAGGAAPAAVGSPGGGLVAQAQGIAPAGGATDSSAGVAPLSNSASFAEQPTNASASRSALPSADPSAWDIPALAKKYNIPEPALRNLAAAEDFQGIGQLIAKRALGNKQVVNGVVVDLDKAPEGVVDGQVFTSTDGKTIQLTKGADGNVQVHVPTGALDSQAAQAGVAAGVKAATTLQKVWDPTAKREVWMTEAQILQRAGLQKPSSDALQGAGTSAGAGDIPPHERFIDPTEQFQRDKDALAVLKNEAAKPGIEDDVKAGLVKEITRQQARVDKGPMQVTSAGASASTSGGPLAAGQSSGEVASAAAAQTFSTNRAKNAADYDTSMNERVRQGGELNMRLQEQLGALSKFRAGGGGETRATLAQAAQAIPGMPKAVVDGIAGGDLASVQEFQKLSAQTAMESLKQAMGGSGRITQAEFKVFSQNNPNIAMDPDAIRKIFDFSTHIYARDRAEQQAFNTFVNNGGDPAQFPTAWTSMQSSLGFTNPSLSAQAPQSTQGWNIRPMSPR